MKDANHHRKHVQKKVIQSLRKDEIEQSKQAAPPPPSDSSTSIESMKSAEKRQTT